eukprot:TRINITY_DN5774_c0_g1_i1.p1 TRINITY_DN5774_c0_g1~~TRINITY_DN5774_c0_g1_i1.p1  ORF type:complete len:176 (+),score=18.42 TRINITY_DN5774_c0_g1_i1:101-628(+)
MALCDDGVVRIIEQGTDSFLLNYALKIHDQSIIDGAISHDSKYLVTITEKQLFFSQIVMTDYNKMSVEPIGFVTLKHRLNKIYWSMDNKSLYSFCKQDIVIYKRPEMEQFDTSSSFEIEINPEIIHFAPFLTEEDSKIKEIVEKQQKEGDEEENKKRMIRRRIKKKKYRTAWPLV